MMKEALTSAAPLDRLSTSENRYICFRGLESRGSPLRKLTHTVIPHTIPLGNRTSLASELDLHMHIASGLSRYLSARSGAIPGGCLVCIACGSAFLTLLQLAFLALECESKMNNPILTFRICATYFDFKP